MSRTAAADGLSPAPPEVISGGYLGLFENGERCPSMIVAHDLITGLDLDDEVAAWLLDVARPNSGRSWRPGVIDGAAINSNGTKGGSMTAAPLE